MNTINENVKKDSLKSTSMRLSEQTLKALKDVARNENLPNQDSAIKWLLASATFAKGSVRFPERSQTLGEIQDLFGRIISKIEENFNLMADMKADAEKQVADKEEELTAKITMLKQQINDNNIKIATLQEALNSVRGHGKPDDEVPVSESDHTDCKKSDTAKPASEEHDENV